jgi:hypothetical protein
MHCIETAFHAMDVNGEPGWTYEIFKQSSPSQLWCGSFHSKKDIGN